MYDLHNIYVSKLKWHIQTESFSLSLSLLRKNEQVQIIYRVDKE
jgi:hypothetical protein